MYRYAHYRKSSKHTVIIWRQLPHKCVCIGTHITEKSTRKLKIGAHCHTSAYVQVRTLQKKVLESWKALNTQLKFGIILHSLCIGTHITEKVLKCYKLTPTATQVLMYWYAHYKISTKKLKIGAHCHTSAYMYRYAYYRMSTKKLKILWWWAPIVKYSDFSTFPLMCVPGHMHICGSGRQLSNIKILVLLL